MSFTKTQWNSGAAPGISAGELNRMEQGIYEASNDAPKFDELTWPLYIAHRGSAFLFPENTLEGMLGSVALGSKVLEFDCQELLDGAFGLMHDDTVNRTTDKTGQTIDYSATGFRNLNTVQTGYKDVPATLLDDVLNAIGNRAFYLPESKDVKSAGALARKFKEYHLENYVMIQSFGLSDLANAVAEGVPTLYLAGSPPDPATAASYGFTAIGTDESGITQQWIDDAHGQGLKVFAYTVDTRHRHDELLSMGVDAFFSDDPLYIQGGLTPLSKDPYINQAFYHGMIPPVAARGSFISPDRWGFPNVHDNERDFLLQGWAGQLPSTFTINYDVTFDQLVSGTYGWHSIALCSPIDYFNDTDADSSGYNCLFGESGILSIYKVTNGSATKLAEFTSTAPTQGQTVPMKVQVTGTQIIFTRTDTGDSATATNSTYRNGYLHFGRLGTAVSFSNVNIS